MEPIMYFEKDILALTGWSRTTLYRKNRDGEFPSKRAISENRVGWIAAEVLDWIKNRPLKNPNSKTVNSDVQEGK